MTGNIKSCFVNASIIINSLGTGNLQLVTF